MIMTINVKNTPSGHFAKKIQKDISIMESGIQYQKKIKMMWKYINHRQKYIFYNFEF